jgi:hypothetical protein
VTGERFLVFFRCIQDGPLGMTMGVTPNGVRGLCHRGEEIPRFTRNDAIHTFFVGDVTLSEAKGLCVARVEIPHFVRNDG